MFNWIKGRQLSGYERLTFINTKWVDLHLIRYPIGIGIPKHKDIIPNKNHYRLNVRLIGPDNFECEKVIFKFWRFICFRPDLYIHSVTPVERKRLVLSIGWSIKTNKGIFK